MKPVIIAGPCVIESQDCLNEVAEELVRLNKKYGLDIIFKSSFDKANRTSINSYRGPGLEKGLTMLNDIREKYGLKLLTDIHESYQAAPAGEVVDILQIPAFLCRQTDLLVAAAQTGKVVNIKKAQFLSGMDMEYPVQKVRESGNDKVWLTERGNMYGYNNLVVDFRNIADMNKCRLCQQAAEFLVAPVCRRTVVRHIGGLSDLGDHTKIRCVFVACWETVDIHYHCGQICGCHTSESGD